MDYITLAARENRVPCEHRDMRVAVDARALQGEATGVGRYLEGLLSAWLALNRGDSVVLLSSKPLRIPALLKGRIEVVTSRYKVPGTLWLQTLAPRAAERQGADIFFGPLGIVPLRLSIPSVATIHDLTPVLHPEWHNARNRLGFGPFLGATVRKARRLVAVSEATRADLVKRHPEAEGKCTVVHNGVSSSPSEPPEVRSTSRPYVLFLGTLEPRKNLERLVSAMETIWDRRSEFPDLVLAGGKGWGLGKFEERLSASRHASRIRRIGYVHPAESEALIRRARLLAYPSLYEGFGLPPLEAMALGTVVVGSSSSSLPEVIGDAGLLPDPEDERAIAAAIEKAEDDESWRSLARQRGLLRAAGFTWKAAAEKTRALFESALA